MMNNLHASSPLFHPSIGSWKLLQKRRKRQHASGDMPSFLNGTLADHWLFGLFGCSSFWLISRQFARDRPLPWTVNKILDAPRSKLTVSFSNGLR